MARGDGLRRLAELGRARSLCPPPECRGPVQVCAHADFEPGFPYETQGVLALSHGEDGTTQVTMALELETGRFTALDAALRKVSRVFERSETRMVSASFDVLSSTFFFQIHVMSHSGEGARATGRGGDRRYRRADLRLAE